MSDFIIFLCVILKKSHKCLANLPWTIPPGSRFALVSAVFALFDKESVKFAKHFTPSFRDGANVTIYLPLFWIRNSL